MRILVIIPAYNEEENLQYVVENLQQNYSQYDYVIVNDGSKDRTAEICRRMSYNLLDLPINIGLAGAVQAGMKYASLHGYDAAIQLDGDGQHDPAYIKTMCDKMLASRADIVMGSRYVEVAKPKSLRMLGNSLIQTLIRLTTGKKVSDPTSGMRLFNKRIVDEFAWNMNYGPEPDTIAYLIRNGAIVEEVQVQMSERIAGQSYLNFSRSVRYMLSVCMSIVFIQWFRKRG